MIIWLNGAFGSGKTTAAYELNKRLPNSFVYDPENVGYFLNKNLPKAMLKDNFQDFKEWRSMNVDMLRLFLREYEGPIIVPMTIIKKQYYDEIITQLQEEGITIHHFILYANKATLTKRLNTRLELPNSWPRQQIAACLHGFEYEVTEKKIVTDNLTVNQVVQEIAQLANLELLADNRSKFQRKIEHIKILLKHIR
ncbi:AAA family ATPase [Bacillus ndiopicus]|uniref:AAA family ATPase n=1 Tax=Bacillus ndiopicus TaxID=1347368 RepID=UPI0005A93C88|nr:AAA family ATPase [Bacillus ndiopicus]